MTLTRFLIPATLLSALYGLAMVGLLNAQALLAGL